MAFPLRVNGGARATMLIALVAVGCGGGTSGTGSDMAAPRPDMTIGVAVKGIVGGERLGMVGGGYVNDASCSKERGVMVEISEGASMGCGAVSDRNIQIFLSNFLPATYVETGPTTCMAFPGGKAFYAIYHGMMNGQPTAFDSVKGTVVLTFYDASTATVGGNFDIDFHDRSSSGTVSNGNFTGSFSSDKCP